MALPLRNIVEFFAEAGAPAPAVAYHTFSIVSGARDSFVGWWHNNIGTIDGRTMTIPNGNAVDIRQFMIGGSITPGAVRFLFGPQRYQVSQFPTRIVAVNGATSIELTRPDPATIIEAGQGNGIDYETTQSTLLTTVFSNGETVNVSLFY